ncbi:unnamed protein product [Linum trigynum]|uniref:Chlorophyllase n=1 Tax=Linum trigynum TaxID=586398 RepID=A0AAV2EAR8_9ROSI
MAMASLLLLLLVFAAAPFSVAPLAVFQPGSFETTTLDVGRRDPSSPPRPLLVTAPTIPGSYPILLFAHGTYLQPNLYTMLFRHISSHGFIVVAPQLFDRVLPSGPTEVEYVAQVANWLPSGLPSVLPATVEPNLGKLAISGHSRGGKSAFAVALGYAETPLVDGVTISAIIGVDPVAGRSRNRRTDPKILTYEPHSFNLSVPVSVIGTGLGNKRRSLLMPPCAPDEVNHVEFYRESRAPASHFVASDYGHMDMLNDWFIGMICRSGRGPRGPMRRAVGGIVVAFLKAYLEGERDDYVAILENPLAAPVKLSPVDNIVPYATLAGGGLNLAAA